MTKINYQALREAAEKATCGVWSLEYGEERFDAGDALIHREVVGYLPICRIEGAHPESGFDEDFQMEQQANAEFIAAASPATVLALLDERERNQQYIKRRDQENEDLTVGKLRVELEAAKKRIAELEAEPVSQTYNLPELIEGMEVSIDVSTCDADLGNRYFGTVTEALELDTVKNGYILLVQDAEPNFDVNGNSPGIPDGWISCSDRMPVIGEINWRTSFPLLVTCEIGVIPAYYGFVRVNGNKHYGFMESLKYGDDSGNHPQTNEYDLISNVTHWMPLPEPPQHDGE
ncbi:TPA: ead/Ea22-like family protein [Escherichia coli]